MNASVQEIVKIAREKKKWTQEDMAAKMGISLRQYNKYESGKFPKFKQEPAAEIDKLLGTNIRELLYEQNVPQETPGNQVNELYGSKDYKPGSLNLAVEIGKIKEWQIGIDATLAVLMSEVVPLIAKENGKSHAGVFAQMRKDIEAETANRIASLNKKKGF